FRLANGPDDLLERHRRAVRLSQDAGHGVLELAQLLGAPALGDVARDSAIALEDPRGVEYRLATYPHPDLAARGIVPAQLQVAKRLARLEQRTVRRPVRFAQVDVLELQRVLPRSCSERRGSISLEEVFQNALNRSCSSCSQYPSAESSVRLRNRSSLSCRSLRCLSCGSVIAPLG